MTQKQEIKDNKFEATLSRFVEFVEQEASRIDEERKGHRRRDGGRIMCCTTFLKQLSDHITTQTVKETEERELCAKKVAEAYKGGEAAGRRLEIEDLRVHIEREVIDPLIDTSKKDFGVDEAIDRIREILREYE